MPTASQADDGHGRSAMSISDFMEVGDYRLIGVPGYVRRVLAAVADIQQ